jgi:hypothetical protein
LIEPVDIRLKELFRMGCMHVDTGGIVGYHQASISQLFAVVAGEGVVKGKRIKSTASRRDMAHIGRKALFSILKGVRTICKIVMYNEKACISESYASRSKGVFSQR